MTKPFLKYFLSYISSWCYFNYFFTFNWNRIKSQSFRPVKCTEPSKSIYQESDENHLLQKLFTVLTTKPTSSFLHLTSDIFGKWLYLFLWVNVLQLYRKITLLFPHFFIDMSFYTGYYCDQSIFSTLSFCTFYVFP